MLGEILDTSLIIFNELTAPPETPVLPGQKPAPPPHPPVLPTYSLCVPLLSNPPALPPPTALYISTDELFNIEEFTPSVDNRVIVPVLLNIPPIPPLPTRTV